MSPIDAAKILDVTPDATPEQIESRFHELRTRLEEKIGKAPTPGLKAKYRESLEEITQAFETLTLAADASALPVLQRQKAEDGQRPIDERSAKAPAAPEPVATKRPAPAKKSGSKEFVVVAMIAVALLAVGGWWVMKVREENYQKERKAAAAKRDAELDARRAVKDRARLAELRIAWEALEQEARAIERKISDFKADERRLASDAKGVITPELLEVRAQMAAHQQLLDWLQPQLLRHPAKVARARAEELLNAGQFFDAGVETLTAQGHQQSLDGEFVANRKSMLTLTGEVSIKVNMQGVRWSLTDAYGRVHTGEGPLKAKPLPLGPLRADFTRANFKDRTQKAIVRRDQPLTLEATFTPAKVSIETFPAGAEVWVRDKQLGVTPLRDITFSPGRYLLELRVDGYPPERVGVDAKEGGWVRERRLLLRPESGVPGFTFVLDGGVDEDGTWHQFLMVETVIPGSPAARAGIKAGDSIAEISSASGSLLKVSEIKDIEDVLAVHAALSGQPGEIRILEIHPEYDAATERPPSPREVKFELMAQRETNRVPLPGKPHENTLGMKFVPIPGTNLLFSIWETRVQDFDAFAQATGYKADFPPMKSFGPGGWEQTGDSWRDPGFSQGPTHPVIGMTIADGVAFCDWLTKKERAEGRLRPNQSYRLPSDAEWDLAVGPAEFPWGDEWPMPANAGNYAGSEIRKTNWKDKDKYPRWFSDTFTYTAPVGSFVPNQYGIFDLGGNAAELVANYEKKPGRNNMERGASFLTGLGYSNSDHARTVFSSAYRSGWDAAVFREYNNGFRIVCVVE